MIDINWTMLGILLGMSIGILGAGFLLHLVIDKLFG